MNIWWRVVYSSASDCRTSFRRRILPHDGLLLPRELRLRVWKLLMLSEVRFLRMLHLFVRRVRQLVLPRVRFLQA